MDAQLILFTDLDGTLLEYKTYSHTQAQEGLELVRSRQVPLIFCSAKTRAELVVIQEKLQIHHPFISENGGAIFIPKGYFQAPYLFQRSLEGFDVIEIGLPYPEIRRRLKEIQAETPLSFTGFGEMSPEEVARATGLALDDAERAKAREYDETVKLDSPQEQEKAFLEALERKGLQGVHGGIFHHAMGPNDKGKAVTLLSGLFRQQFGAIRTVGIGDSRNDEPMLAAVDLPLLVQKPGGAWDKIHVSHLERSEGVGPAGWNCAVCRLLSG